jgi:hypothetical protein
MSHVLLISFCVLAWSGRTVCGKTWTEGRWGIDIAGSGTPGSSTCLMVYPGGSRYGNALMVYYEVEQGFAPQMWVFLTDGFFRQVSPSNTFGTSYRMFSYWSSAGEMCDVSTAVTFRVVGVTAQDELEVELQYRNTAECGDDFSVAATAFLEPPDGAQAAMRLDLAVKNESGREVTPHAAIHRALSEQWNLVGISSMYVADDFCAGLPEWYDSMDPTHRYVGTYTDGSFFNDGFSQNGQFEVSPHDISSMFFSGRQVKLDHSTDSCPPIYVSGYSWYGDLVVLHETSDFVRVEHSYDSGKTHEVRVSACSGLVTSVESVCWAATFNRYDGNMVDGDNIQIKLSMNEAVDGWPSGASQYLSARFTAGVTNPVVVRYPFRLHLQPSGVCMDGGLWSLYDTVHSNQPSGSVVALQKGTYTATVNEVQGWVPPQDRVFSVPVSVLNGYSMTYAEFPENPQPLPLSAFALTDSVMLRWPDPRLSGYSNQTVIVRGDTSDYPASLSAGEPVYQGDSRWVLHGSLTPGVPVYYTLWVSHDGIHFFEPVDNH